jgi:hypothetical protein
LLVSTEESAPESPPVDETAVPEAEAEEPIVEGAEDAAEDRLFALVAFGLMILLLLCVVLVLIAYRRPPAGL